MDPLFRVTVSNPTPKSFFLYLDLGPEHILCDTRATDAVLSYYVGEGLLVTLRRPMPAASHSSPPVAGPTSG